MSKPSKPWIVWAIAVSAVTVGAALLRGAPSLAAPSYSLEIAQIAPGAEYRPGGAAPRPARVGDRLYRVGDRVFTGNAGAMLTLGAVSIVLSDRAELVVRNLYSGKNGSLIAQLTLNRGHARLQSKPFENPDSLLQVSTPTVAIALRGGDVALGIQPNGRTTVAALRESVTAASLGQVVQVLPGTYSTIAPGEVPSRPSPVRNDLNLKLEMLSERPDGRATLVAQVAPENLVQVNEVPVNIDLAGRFGVLVPMGSDRLVRITVRNPEGKTYTYSLPIPKLQPLTPQS